MAYSTGVSGNTTELVAAIKTFAQSQGFTVSGNWVAGTSGQTVNVTCVSKDGWFYHFAWDNTKLIMDIATATTGAGMPHEQPGASGNFFGAPNNLYTCFVNPIAGPHVGYHLFSNGSAIHCVVELVTNVFQHLSFGQIRKVGNWVGGAYVSANQWNPQVQSGVLNNWDSPWHGRIFEGLGDQVRDAVNIGGYNYSTSGFIKCTFNGVVNSRLSNSVSQRNVTFTRCSPWSYGFELLQDSPNQFNSRSVLSPVEFCLSSLPPENGSAPPHWLELGQLETVAALNMANMNPKDLINTDWMVFPLSQKNGPGILYVNSQDYGLAYKR